MLSVNFTKLAAVCAAIAPFASASSVVSYSVYQNIPTLVATAGCTPPADQSGNFETGTVANPGCVNIPPSYYGAFGFTATPDDACVLNAYTEFNCAGTEDSGTKFGIPLVPAVQGACTPIFDMKLVTEVPAKSIQVICPS